MLMIPPLSGTSAGVIALAATMLLAVAAIAFGFALRRRRARRAADWHRRYYREGGLIRTLISRWKSAPKLTFQPLGAEDGRHDPPLSQGAGRAYGRSMTEDDATHRLGEALNHLHAFAATFNPGGYVDEESALTADDLNVILEKLEAVHGAEKRSSEL